MHVELFLAIFHLVPYYLLLHNFNYNGAFISINLWIDYLSQKRQTFALHSPIRHPKSNLAL